MSGRQNKKIRKIVKNAYNEKIEEVKAIEVFRAYREKINSYPLKTRLKIAFKIMIRKF